MRRRDRGIYPSSPANDCAYVLGHSESSVVFVEDAEQLAKIDAIRGQLPELRRIVAFDRPSGADAASTSYRSSQSIARRAPSR